MSSCQWFEKIYFFLVLFTRGMLVGHSSTWTKKIIVGFWEDLLGQGSICFSDKETTSVLLGQILPDIRPGSELVD